MGWSIGYDSNWHRDIGYGVPAYCDHPKCNAEIDRGLSYVCCGEQPYGGDDGCGLFFCGKHADWRGRCPRCSQSKPPYKRIKPEHPRWIHHKLTDESWAEWRAENPEEVETIKISDSMAFYKRRVKMTAEVRGMDREDARPMPRLSTTSSTAQA